MTISRAGRLFRTNQLTSQQLCQHSHNLALFGDNSLCLNAYSKILPLDQILEQAQESDERIQNGTPKSLLDGIPVSIKANVAVGRFWEMPHACSAILAYDGRTNNIDNRKGEEFSSTNNFHESDIAKKLLTDCGAVVIGITNMDEFGMGSLGINNGVHHQSKQCITEQKQYSPTYNPLPWISMIRSLKQHFPRDEDEEDVYWLQLIKNSKPENPHGIDDENALGNLQHEVQRWISDNVEESFSRRKNESAHFTHSSPILSSGGSSSGAAVAAAHGSSLLSIGTDTGGSLRLPSAWTSTVGFKPSYGTWSRYGVVSYASSLDTVGFIARTAECAQIAWSCLRKRTHETGSDEDTHQWSGHLGRDSTSRVYHDVEKIDNDDYHSIDHTGTPLTGQLSTGAKPLTNVRIGIPSAFSIQELPPLIAATWSDSANYLQNFGGATLVPISSSRLSSEWIKLALASYYVLACAEASSNLSRYDGVRYGMDLGLDTHSCEESTNYKKTYPLIGMKALEQQISATRAYGFGEEIQRRILAGTSVLSSDRFHTHYEAAAVVRTKLSQSLANLFRSSQNNAAEESDKVDVVLVPTALSFPCTLHPTDGDGIMEDVDPTAAFANDVMTIPISLGGFPSISVPVTEKSLNNVNDCSTDAILEMNQVGMQIFASRGSEELVLRVAITLQ
mmetsp:Transcript_52795/g.112163  ORF Transcript_52795/g.112163 Transcript_52795/m.112163 type:complete len:675 (-) Transcript_52795:84-2108(-)|eukprot:CAMPEP_0172564784 /NCGR_PEP_ID=MMETSP1067-20121228/105710_1 /TAXON_ID=265564 ORGANISM="Thalassiosira punctigera, Strain Tpunct2005C2" /NCGR_SAMPLE_ID=MMETSP1067 /ASSEMBLY_ACC=CAM_ASM_000444 /LENGTH=674 /DNA_ID=CAMNT_0013355537 /DNA_START=162 /DNA_END=2186 /DNA_ORIENTATION=-